MTPDSNNEKMAAVSRYWTRDSHGTEWPKASLDLLATISENNIERLSGFTVNGEYFDVLSLEYLWKSQVTKFLWMPGLLVKLQRSDSDMTDIFNASELKKGGIYVVLTESINDLADEARHCRREGYYVMLASVEDIDSIADTSWRPDGLLNYKTSRVIIRGLSDRDAIFEERSYSKFQDLIRPRLIDTRAFDFEEEIQNLDASSHPRHLMKHPFEDDLKKELSNDSDATVFIHGPSSAGKTSLVLSAGFDLYTSKKWDGEILYIDIGKINEHDMIQLSAHLMSPKAEQDGIIMIGDNLQSNPKVSEQLVSVTDFLRKGTDQKINFIGITWPSYWEELQTDVLSHPYSDFAVEPNQMKNRIVSRFAGDLQEDLVDQAIGVANDDLLILHEALTWLSNENKVLDTDSIDLDFAKNIWEQEFETVDNISKKKLESTILLVSCLGRYEIAVDDEFIRRNTKASPDDLSNLYKEKILRKNSGRITLGHRSYCDLLFRHLYNKEDTRKRLQKRGLEKPSDIVLDYIVSLTPSEIWPILKSIQTHAGFQSGESVAKHGDVIINTWQTIDYLAEKVTVQQSSDPTWNKTPSSAQFAIESLQAIGQEEISRESIEFLRSAYSVGIEKDRFNVNINKFSTTKDFEQIKERMLQEDQNGDPCGEPAKEINEERIHANWVRGVILCAEAHFGELSDDNLSELAKCVESYATHDGYFYPERVPWVTARVLIGLALCGRTVENSKTVKNISNWLLNHPSFQNGCWQSGTGTWNTWIEATALSVIGLIMAGVSKENTKIQSAIDILFEHRHQWIEEDMLLDGVVALQAYSLVSEDLHTVVDEVSLLSMQARDSALWINATAEADEIFDQSCLVAQAAAGLMTTMLEFLHQDLSSLLNHFDLQVDQDHRKSPHCFISYSWDSKAHKKWVQSFAENLRNLGINIEIDKTGSNPSDDLPQYMEQAVANCDCAILIGTPNYARKANERSGGVGYEFKMIAERLLNDNDDFVCIPLLVEGDRDEAIPVPLKSTFSVDFRDTDEYDEKLEMVAKTIRREVS